jgi:Domain of unknown function (DUF4177)
MQFKVLTQKDRFFSRKFDPEILEQALNSYGEEGWEMAGVATATFPGFMGREREELVIILKREK